jgi:hypothetical protein
MLSRVTDSPDQASSGPEIAPRQRRVRRYLAIALVTLAALLAFVAILAIWVDRQALNTENWTRASSEMLEQPVVRNRVADYLVEQLYANVDVAGEIRAALPERAQPLAGPAAAGLRDFVERSARKALAGPRAQQAWEDANRSAHMALLHVLRGGGPVVSTDGNGVVGLNLEELLVQLDQRTGVGGRLAERLPASAAQITVLRSDQLEAAQTTLRVLDALPIVSVVASLVLFGAALAVAPGSRRQATRAYGFGLIAAGAGALAARSLGGDAMVDALVSTEAGEPAAREVWTIGTDLLDEVAYAAIGYGAFLVIGAWLAGPTWLATGVRRFAAPYLREPAIAYAVFVALAAAVVLWWAPTPALRNPVTAILIVVLAGCGFEALRRRTTREFPEADRHEFERRVRARLGAAYHSARGTAASGGAALAQQAAGLRRGQGDAAADAPASGSSRVEQLERLSALRRSGALDEEEFRLEKARVLRTSSAPL